MLEALKLTAADSAGEAAIDARAPVGPRGDVPFFELVVDHFPCLALGSG